MITIDVFYRGRSPLLSLFLSDDEYHCVSFQLSKQPGFADISRTHVFTGKMNISRFFRVPSLVRWFKKDRRGVMGE